MIEPKFLVGDLCGVGVSVENTTGKSPMCSARTFLRIVAARGQANVRDILSILILVGSVLRAAPIDDINGILFCLHQR